MPSEPFDMARILVNLMKQTADLWERGYNAKDLYEKVMRNVDMWTLVKDVCQFQEGEGTEIVLSLIHI